VKSESEQEYSETHVVVVLECAWLVVEG